jgi:C1A family cysteine protease
MRSLFIAAALGACTQAMTVESNFNFMQFMANHSKSYDTVEEYALRFAQWLETDTLINEINNPDSEWTHTAGHNFMSDLTDEEINALMTLQTPPEVPEMTVFEEAEESVEFGGSKDWRTSNCVNDVQNQGSCGSCWSFTAVAAMETSYCHSAGKLLKLSEQQFVDCASQAPYYN